MARIFQYRKRPPAEQGTPLPVVECIVMESEIRCKSGAYLAGLTVTCTKCEQYERVFGRGERSLVAALANLRQLCPRKETNHYIARTKETES